MLSDIGSGNLTLGKTVEKLGIWNVTLFDDNGPTLL
jgi:hypothetical protein